MAEDFPPARTRRLWHGLIVAALAVSSLPAMAQKAAPAALPEIEWGYPEQPPRAFTNAQGQADGHYARLLTILFRKAGISWHGASYPVRRLMANLDSGATNFSILVKNPTLDKCCLYGKTPVWNDELRVYYVPGKTPLRSKEDLAGKNLITIAGFAYGGLINFINDPKNNISNQVVFSRTTAFKMLQAGRGDYVLDYAEAVAAEGVAQTPDGPLRSDTIEKINMYFVLARSYPNAEAVLERLDTIYKTMRETDVKREYTK